MKQRKSLKAIISLIVAIVAIVCIVTTIAICHLVRENKLEDIQNEVIAELERNEGKYDERSIVLDSTSKARAEELAALFGAELRITENGRYARLTLPEGTTVKDVWSLDENRVYLEEMSADYQISIAELEEEVDKSRLPMSPNYTVSDADYALQTYLNYINMQNVWNNYTGAGVTVAVIDTGIDTDHPEFAGRISEYSYNATEDKIVKDWGYDWSLIEDEQGHGTAVTGVIAGTMNSGNIAGIAPNVNIIVIKAECDEFGNFYRTSDLVFGLYYAIERDVQVVNMSFGTSAPRNPFAEATQLAYDSDIICVAAAGNEGTSALTYPAADSNVIGVGALAENSWTLADYSNYGDNSDLVAPGTVYTSLKDGAYGTMNGTSFSSPITAAAIALFMQNNRYITFDDITEILFASSYDLGSLGNDWDYGFGALDVYSFVCGQRGTVTYDMLTDELENEEGLFIRGIALQELPEPERLYAIFDGWYYDDTFTQAVDYYADAFEGDLTLYAKWVNEDDGVPYTYVILDDGTVEIRSYTGHRRFITVPEKIEGRVVSSIGDFAFSGQTRLREVGLPSGLTNIGRYAFENCSNLVTMHIPAGVKKMGEYAFASNVRLYTISFAGNSVLESIGDFAFSGCGNLERIELPATLTSVNGSAFFGTTALTAITVRNGNTAFISKDGVLFDVTSTTLVAYPAAHGTTYTVPEGTINLADYSFPMARIKNINLGTIQTIGNGAFVYSSLESLIIPDSVISIGNAAFEYNTNLTTLSIGRGITAIPVKAFAGCSSLKVVTIPNGIRVIDKSAFNSSGLESIVFESGSTLNAIGPSAFYNCYIREIDIPASVIEIGDGAFSGFLVGNPLERVGFALESQLTIIGAEAFAKCHLLEAITLPKSLTTIGNQAFMSSALKEITVPSGVTSLGCGAFACCDSLTSIEIAAGNTVYHDINGVVYTLDNTVIHTYPAGRYEAVYTVEAAAQVVSPWAFAGTSKLGSVTLPEGMTEIGEYGFYLCGASGYTLPSTLVEIEQYAFAKNKNLNYIQIPDNVLQIGRYAFAESLNLYSVNFNSTAKLPRISYGSFAYSGIQYFTVPANVSTIAQGAFEGCKNLYSITFAENSKLESISAYMFDGCENLSSITFNNGSALTSIQAHGLEGMDNLTGINFGDAKLTNVDNFAFRFCESLSSITFPETLTNIGRYAFYGCKNLSSLTVPVNVEHIGSYAFLGTNELDLYLSADSMPEYLDENWDHGLKAYYTGVTSVNTSGDYKYATLTSGNIAIIEYLGTAESVDLSTLSLGAPIATIGGSAFKDSTVKAIVLPETLTEIQAEAFMYTALESISIPASVTFIGREAFAHTDIATLTIPTNSSLKYIEQYAFEGTDSLKFVALPASLEKMGTGVFLKSGLEAVVFADGIKLTEIPQKAFAETKLTSAALPDSVTLVNHNAFNNVETLGSVTFGNNEGIRLMSNAFYHTGLTSMTIPANVTYIGEYCFVALKNLTEFTVDANNPNYAAIDGFLVTKSGRKLIAVPAGRTGTLNVPVCVEEIGFGAFEESSLSAINFDPNANILTFGYRAFFNAESITEMTIPASVVSIDYYAFAYCENLKTVTFAEGNKLKGIYEGAFCGDINLENIVIPDSIVEISDFAFYGCSKIAKLPVSETNTLKGIYDYAFAYTGLSGEFTAPETLIDIGNYAFLGCKFTKVTVPDTNQKQFLIGIGAFEGCNQLTEITLPFIGASFEDEEISWFGYIFGAGAYEANETYVPASLKTVTITDGITFVGIGGFAYCTGLENINVPHSVSVLYNLAFAETTARYELTNTILTIRRFDQYINYSAQNGHFGLGFIGDLVLSDGITAIYGNTFSNIESLTSVTIPSSVLELGNSAFYNCSQLENVILANGLCSIGSYTFKMCPKLTKIEIPATVQSMGDYLFDDNIDVKIDVNNQNFVQIDGIVYDNPITKIIYVTKNVSNVIYIPEGVTKIGEAFKERDNIERIVLPESITDIGTYQYCKGLKSIVLPSHLTKIDDFAFLACESLIDVTIPEGVTYIGMAAFDGCKNLGNITIPKNVVLISDAAFSSCDKLFEVINQSNLDLTIGSNSFGSVALNAKVIIDKNGNKTYKDEQSGFECIDTSEGFRFIKENGEYSLIAYIGNEDTIILPESINGNNYKLAGVQGAKNIIVPERYTVIESEAFRGNLSLKSVIFLGDVTAIEDYAFDSCYNLVHIILPDTIKSIGTQAFYYCTSLESITIPSGVSVIENYVFSGCRNLKEVILPDGTVSIGYGAFSWCENLPSIIIPQTVSFIGDSAFTNCKKLKSITIPEGITRIEHRTFSACDQLEQVSLPASLTEIGEYSFSDCHSLNEINIPAKTSIIGSYSFAGCESLSEIVISDNVVFIGSGAFGGNTNIVFSENNNNYQFVDGILYDKPATKIISVTDKIPETLKIIDGVTSLEQVFKGCENLKSIVIPASVKLISNEAFMNCVNLHSVVLNDGITEIQWSAFNGCESLINISIPDSVKSIGGSAFEDCLSLKTICLPNSVTELGYFAFYRCFSLTSIELPNTLKVINDGTFDSCTSLEAIVLPSELLTIGSYAFSNCVSLIEINIPDSVTTIGRAVFQNCQSLLQVDIPKNATMELGAAFNACDSLHSVSLPETITFIDSAAFSSCTNLKRIEIPKSVKFIVDDAFIGCYQLYQIINHSDLEFRIGSDSYGEIAKCAKLIIDKNGNKTYADETSGFEIIETTDGFRFIKENGKYELVAYLGNEETIVLPKNINNEPYTIKDFRDGVEIIIPDTFTSIDESAFHRNRKVRKIILPDTITTIGNGAFSDCIHLENIVLPPSVERIGYNAFYNTAYYNNRSNWVNGMLFNNGWLIAIDDIQYLPNIDFYTGVADNIYLYRYNLKKAIWDGNIETVSNLETLVINDIYKDKYIIPGGVTLKNIVISKKVALDELNNTPYIFMLLSDVTIFVEHLEEDLRWDDNFPGWNNGNRVIYGDKWSWTNFYDADGTLLYSAPRRHSEIIRMPIVDSYKSNGVYYEFIGWDLDGDGTSDAIPATSVGDIEAHAIYVEIHLPGDIDGDETVTIDDATLLFHYVAGWNVEVNTAALDVTGDGEINLKDVVALYRYIAGWDVEIH